LAVGAPIALAVAVAHAILLRPVGWRGFSPFATAAFAAAAFAATYAPHSAQPLSPIIGCMWLD
jgi:hypothetical protein